MVADLMSLLAIPQCSRAKESEPPDVSFPVVLPGSAAQGRSRSAFEIARGKMMQAC